MGLGVGLTVGSGVGDEDGEAVGLGVGFTVGDGVGDAVGLGVGFTVGGLVRSGVVKMIVVLSKHGTGKGLLLGSALTLPLTLIS